MPNGPASPGGPGQEVPGQNKNRMALYVVIVVAVLSVLIIPNLLSKTTTNT